MINKINMEKEGIPTEKDYNLSKVKLLPTGGIKVNYQITQVIDGEASVIDRDETCTRDVHPDLVGLFEDLRSIVARVFNVTAFLSFLESPDMKLPEAKRLLAREFAEGLLEKIDVRGVSWSGSDENVGVVVTAVMETPNGLKSVVNTPRIKLAQISFGFEEELERICGQIKSEIYDYLFRGKQAQLSLFGGTVEPENELDGQE